MSGEEPNPGPLNDKEHNTDSWIQTQEDILADLCANAPTAEVRDCLRLYNPKITNKQHKAEFDKCCTCFHLGIPESTRSRCLH